MTSKCLLHSFWWLLTLLATTTAASAQNAPGWGRVKYFGQSLLGGNGENSTGGMGRDAAGNLYMAGGYVGTPTIGNITTTNLGGTEAFLAKYDPDGNLLWLRALHGTGNEATTKLIVEPSGRCTLGGYFGGGPVGGNLSFSEFGSSLVLPGPVQLGLANYGNASNPSWGIVPFLATVEADGTLTWATCPSPTYDFTLQDLARDGQGGIYMSVSATGTIQVAGTTYQRLGTSDGVLLKYNAAGQMQWLRRGGATGVQVTGAALKVDLAGAVYWMTEHSAPFAFNQATVGTGGYGTLIKLSAANQVRWTKSQLLQVTTNSLYYNNFAYLTISGIDASSGALYLSTIRPGGSTISFGGAASTITVPGSTSSSTQCIVRCDTAGQVNWVKPITIMTPTTGSAPGFQALPKLFPIGNGFTVITSTVGNGQTTFSGSSVIYGAAEAGLVCVLHYNTTTDQTEWVRVGGTLPSTLIGGTQVAGAAVDPAGNVFIAGKFIGPATFGATSLPATGMFPWVFLAELSQTVLATKTATAGKPWQMYPNPATGTVRLAGLPAQAQVRVLDALGRQVAQWPAAAPETVRNLAGLAPGLYLLQVSSTTETYQPQRLLVE